MPIMRRVAEVGAHRLQLVVRPGVFDGRFLMHGALSLHARTQLTPAFVLVLLLRVITLIPFEPETEPVDLPCCEIRRSEGLVRRCVALGR